MKRKANGEFSHWPMLSLFWMFPHELNGSSPVRHYSTALSDPAVTVHEKRESSPILLARQRAPGEKWIQFILELVISSGVSAPRRGKSAILKLSIVRMVSSTAPSYSLQAKRLWKREKEGWERERKKSTRRIHHHQYKKRTRQDKHNEGLKCNNQHEHQILSWISGL